MKRRALVIGSQIEGLTGAEHDARRMRDELARRGFDVDLRCGDDATRDGILDGYDALIARTTADDAAAIYYSGHGLYATNSEPGEPDERLRAVQAIAPSDLRAGDDHDFRGITGWELSLKLAQLTARTRNATAILDCCHAAHMTRDAAARALVPRALPHPVRVGFRAHLAALEQRYGHVPLDAAGNADAVRVLACGQTETAFEHTNAAGHRAGIFTQSLLELLAPLVDDAPLSWAALGDALRSRVARQFALQHPAIEGPVERLPFSLATAARGLAAHVSASGDHYRIATGWITGAQPGDLYGVMPLGAERYDDARAIAALRIASVGPLDAVADLAYWRPGHRALPADAVALPLERRATARGVAVIADDPARTAIVNALDHTRVLRPAAPGDDRPPIATLRLAGARLTLEDAAGPLPPVRRYPDELADAIHGALDLGVAERVRALAGDQRGEHGLGRDQLAIEWGVAIDGVAMPQPPHGAWLGLGDRIYLRIRNTGPARRYIHVLNVGVRSTISLLTKHRAPTGVALEPGAALTLGERDHQLAGLELTWPAGLSLDSAPRIDEVYVFATTQPLALGILESHAPPPRGDAPLHALLTQLVGTTRAAGPPADRDAFVVERVSYLLHPRAAALIAPAQYQIDRGPARAIVAGAPEAWVPEPVARAASIAVELTDLVLRPPLGEPARGDTTLRDLRIDALICTRSPHRAEVCIARTVRFRNVRPGAAIDPVSLYRGNPRDFLDIHLWVACAAPGSMPERALDELLELDDSTPRFEDAVSALLSVGNAAPWVTALGASAALAGIAAELVAVQRAVGLFHATFSSRDRFGIGRHPAHGAHRAHELAFAVNIRDRNAPA